MTSYCGRRPWPKCIQDDSSTDRRKSLVFHIPWYHITTTYVLTLTIWALERSAQMIPWPRLLKSNFIFYFCQGSTIEVSRHCRLKVVQLMSFKTVCTIRISASCPRPTGMSIVCAGNVRLVGDSLLTFHTGYVQLVEPFLVAV